MEVRGRYGGLEGCQWLSSMHGKGGGQASFIIAVDAGRKKTSI